MRSLLTAAMSLSGVVVISSAADNPAPRGFFPQSVAAELALEARFKAMPDPARMRENMRRMSARPHHVGSPYDADNANWILQQYQSYGWDAHIETFDVLFPTPIDRLVEMVAPTRYKAALQEPTLAVDPTSGQIKEQLPSYNAYSGDGDVTGPLVFVNH